MSRYKTFNGRKYKVSNLPSGPKKDRLVKLLMKARRDVGSALKTKTLTLNEKLEIEFINKKITWRKIVAIRKVKGGYGVFIDDKKKGKIQRTKKGNIRMKILKLISHCSAKRHMAAVMIGKARG